jgi:hypothetical protein
VLQSRWLIFLPVAIFALFAPQPAQASQTGLLVRGYQIDEIPPTKSDVAYPLCGSSIEPFINATWDYEQNLFGECGWDSFMLHYTGYLQIPEHETIEFWVASDDGGTVKIGTEEFGVWQDQGCSATETGLIDIEAGTQPLDAWFYENGGGTCFMLAWNIDNTGWAIVQPEFFTSEPLPEPSTTTQEPSTTTTVIQSSTTTTSIYQPTTTAELQTTTTSLVQSSSTQPIPQSVPVVVATTSAPATTTTQEPPQETTLTTSTIPEPSPETTEVSEPTLPMTTTTIQPVATTEPITEESLVQDTTTSSTETTALPVLEPQEPLTSEQFIEVLSALSDASAEEVSAIVETILSSDLSSEQAEQLVASAEVLTAITGEQAAQLFQEIEPTQLSESMAAVIADALNSPDVPTEVKEAFEGNINIFGNDGFATYIPLDSVVNVAVRRTIIAGTTILVAMPTPAVTRRV